MASHQSLTDLEGISRAFSRLSIVTAAGMMLFMVAGLTMLGLTGDVVQLMETHRWLPFTATLGALVLIFISSGTRDPGYYHPVETTLVLFTVVVMMLYAFLDAFVNFLNQFDPWATVIVFLLMLVCSAILAR